MANNAAKMHNKEMRTILNNVTISLLQIIQINREPYKLLSVIETLDKYRMQAKRL